MNQPKASFSHEQLQIFAHMGASIFTAIGAALAQQAEFSHAECPMTNAELQEMVLGNTGLNAFLELVRGLDANADPYVDDADDAAPEAEAAE